MSAADGSTGADMAPVRAEVVFMAGVRRGASGRRYVATLRSTPMFDISRIRDDFDLLVIRTVSP